MVLTIVIIYQQKKNVTVLLNERIARHGGNSTHVAGVSCHLDVPTLSPHFSPRVFDDPVVSLIAGSIAHCKNGVVKVY